MHWDWKGKRFCSKGYWKRETRGWGEIVIVVSLTSLFQKGDPFFGEVFSGSFFFIFWLVCPIGPLFPFSTIIFETLGPKTQIICSKIKQKRSPQAQEKLQKGYAAAPNPRLRLIQLQLRWRKRPFNAVEKRKIGLNKASGRTSPLPFSSPQKPPSPFPFTVNQGSQKLGHFFWPKDPKSRLRKNPFFWQAKQKQDTNTPTPFLSLTPPNSLSFSNKQKNTKDFPNPRMRDDLFFCLLRLIRRHKQTKRPLRQSVGRKSVLLICFSFCQKRKESQAKQKITGAQALCFFPFLFYKPRKRTAFRRPSFLSLGVVCPKNNNEGKKKLKPTVSYSSCLSKESMSIE